MVQDKNQGKNKGSGDFNQGSQKDPEFSKDATDLEEKGASSDTTKKGNKQRPKMSDKPPQTAEEMDKDKEEGIDPDQRDKELYENENESKGHFKKKQK